MQRFGGILLVHLTQFWSLRSLGLTHSYNSDFSMTSSVYPSTKTVKSDLSESITRKEKAAENCLTISRFNSCKDHVVDCAFVGRMHSSCDRREQHYQPWSKQSWSSSTYFLYKYQQYSLTATLYPKCFVSWEYYEVALKSWLGRYHDNDKNKQIRRMFSHRLQGACPPAVRVSCL